MLTSFVDSAGLMVQCDKCEVWQHCSCMGLQAEKLPEQYYCELCRPDFHQLIKNPNGRYYNKNYVYICDRSDLFNILCLLLFRPKRLYDATGTNSAPSDNKISETKGPIKRRRKTNTSSNNNNSHQRPHTRQSPLIEVEQEEPPMKKQRQSNDKAEKKYTKKSPKATIPIEEKPVVKINTTTTTAATSATATATLNVTPYWNHTDGKPNEEPPIYAKVKYPNSKMTITDMNKRTQQIMEYLMKLKNEQPLIQTPGRSRSYSTCSSLSSVSTPTDGAPLTPTLSGKDDEEEPIELIEKISKDIIEFQQRFGIVNQL